VHLSQQRIDRVTELVLATISHKNPLPGDLDMAFFLDIDLAILAAPQEQYDSYASKIRKEYGHVSDDAYRAGRSKVLQAFLDRDRIYTSEIFDGSGMEGRARTNIKREIESLTS
jgi:predicted metal-dependent HD superfamily phosphohydrolase